MRKFSMIAACALACGLSLPADYACAEAPKGPTPGAAVVNSLALLVVRSQKVLLALS